MSSFRYRPKQGSKGKNKQPFRKKSFHQRSTGPVRRVASPEEKKFLAGTAIDPYPRIILEKGSDDLSVRAFDLVCPIGMGQRSLVISPPGAGKTTFLKNICHAVTNGYPDMKVYCLLIDERPEEVTDFKRGVNAKVYSSSTDHSHESHIKVADSVIAEAFKDAAEGKNVMILLDSLTRLARVHNSQTHGRGRTLSGGVDADALTIPRRIFGAARNVEEFGSITIIATILVETGSCMDDVIFEEFKGTGNMELVLSRKLKEHRIFPAIDVLKSGTRRVELLFEPEEFRCLELLYKGLSTFNDAAAIEKLLGMLKKYPTNSALLEAFKKL